MHIREVEFKNLKNDLERYYEKKFPNKSNKKTEFADFIIFLLIQIDNYYSQIKKSLTILTTSYNVSDGIGDYVNQADFTEWLCDVFDQFKNIQVQSISILEKEKFTLANRIMPASVKKNGVVMVSSRDDLTQLDNSTDLKHIFLSYEIADSNLNDPRISNIINSTELLINLAVYMNRNTSLLTLFSQVKKESLVQSRAEYGPLNSKPYCEYPEPKLYYETCMGAESRTTGLKFYKRLQSLCRKNLSDEEKATLFETMDNKNLIRSITGTSLNAANYIKNNGFAFGYIQSKPYSILFARLMIAKSEDKKDGVVMMVNLSHFKDVSDNKYFMEHLSMSGYKRIKFVNNDGTTSEIPVPSLTVNTDNKDNKDHEAEHGETGKILTLIEFRGTSQTDKEKIIAMSDMVAGSGNSSFSEMLSACRYPFIQPIRHVLLFYKSFINEIEKSNIQDGKLLQEYLLLNINCIEGKLDIDNLKILYDEEKINNNTKKLIEIVSNKETVRKIMNAWGQYCTFLEKNRNAYDDFIEIISTFIMQKGLEIDPTIVDTLITFIPPGSVICGYTLLHLCIEKNLFELASKLIENHPELINTKCMYKDYTPIMMAARYRQYSLVAKLLTLGASIHDFDKDNLTIVDHAIINKDLKLMELLLNKFVELNDSSNQSSRLFKTLVKLYLDEYLNNNFNKEIKSPENMFNSINKTLLHFYDSNADESKFNAVSVFLLETINSFKKDLDACNTVNEIWNVLQENTNKELAMFLAEKLHRSDPSDKLTVITIENSK